MITAVVGSGGKTTLIHQLAKKYRAANRTVCILTTTHMYIEEDTLLTDDADVIIGYMKENGIAMAGIPEGEKITALSDNTYQRICEFADEILIEADGSKHFSLKYPNATEPVIPSNVEKVIVVCGLSALGEKAKDVIFRLDEACAVLEIDGETRVNASHVQTLVQKGYLENPMLKDKEIEIRAVPTDTLYSRVVASLIEANMDVSIVDERWFEKKPTLFICGAGHVGKNLYEMASLLDFEVKVMDDRAEFANTERFPGAKKVICDSFENLSEYLEPEAYYVIVTSGHKDDYNCVSTILKSSFRYLGMIGSKGKVAKAFEKLKGNGFSDEDISKIHAPIGLKIGAVTPAEIAVSILAQIIEIKNKDHASSVSKELLESKEHGVLCIIIEKRGSAPRGVGSMMLVTQDGQIDTIGGGAVESAAICEARTLLAPAIRDYQLNEKDAIRLGMVCGGMNKVLFVPV